ncbi:IS3 family transposase [Streptomyces sp. JNUCC 63]
MIDHLRDKGLGVDPVCRVLDLSPSTYFARKTRPKSARRLRDEELIPLVTAVWEDSGRTYGARRVTRALVRAGHQVARCTVERLMRELGIEGVIRGRRRRTTVPEPSAPRPPDLVNRRFAAERPNQLWLADLTYIRTWSGWVYVAFVLDAYSRRIVGWQAATHMRADLPLDALEMALWRQKIKKDADLIHHSDSEYVECWMSPGFLARTATDARGYRCRDAPRPPDPHSDRPRCPSSDLSVARGIPARHPPRRRP